MPNPSYDLVGRNFVLKRVGDELFLPCTAPISCKPPSYVPGSKFVYCEVTGFDHLTGELSLNNQTDYTPRDAAAYATSVRMNSDAILAAGVKSFKIYYGGSHWLGTPFFEGNYSESSNESSTHLPPKPLPLSINKKFPIPFSALQFEKNLIRFSLEVDLRLRKVDFEVPYPKSRKEFDSVKDYFEKVFGKKTVDCNILLEAVGQEVLSRSARFIPDDPFDFSVIEKVSNYVILATIFNSEDTVFLVEEKLKLVIGLDEINRNLDGLLKAMDKMKKSKHYDHLRHLSSLHDAGTFRLRMTGQPVSFIFVIKGTKNYFLVWETYETEEATYIWRLENSEGQSQRQEMIDLVDKIKWLRERNRRLYRKSAPANFQYIEHDYSQPNGGVEKWKGLLAAHVFL
jgi:hypothetical protein